jgi:lactoylglutathione lyase
MVSGTSGQDVDMRTLHLGLRVADLDRSLAFYTAVGYQVVGSVPGTALGHLTMLKLPDDEFVTVELVHDPGGSGAPTGTGLSHFVITVDSLDTTVADLTASGIDVDPPGPAGSPDDVRTTWLTDPDGNRIELVQWPAGHPAGLSAADWSG